MGERITEGQITHEYHHEYDRERVCDAYRVVGTMNRFSGDGCDMSRSLVSLFNNRACWISFWPKYVRVGSIILNNLVTTVATPLKNVGRVVPSIWWLNPFTSTKVPFWVDTSWEMPDGYISCTDGRKTALGVRVTGRPEDESGLGAGTERERRTVRSCGKVRG